MTFETHDLGHSQRYLVLSLFYLCSQTKFQDAPSADGESVAGGVTVATASDKVVVKVSIHRQT